MITAFPHSFSTSPVSRKVNQQVTLPKFSGKTEAPQAQTIYSAQYTEEYYRAKELAAQAKNTALTPEEQGRIFTDTMFFQSEANKAKVLSGLSKTSTLTPETRSRIFTTAKVFLNEGNKVKVLYSLVNNATLTMQEQERIRSIAVSFKEKVYTDLLLKALPPKPGFWEKVGSFFKRSK